MAKKFKFKFDFGLRAGANGRDGVDGIRGTDGLDGTTPRLRYTKTANPETIPPFVSNNINPGSAWVATIPNYVSPEAVWMIQAEVNSNNTLKSNWTGPVRVTGIDGLDGAPGLPPNYKIFVFKKSTLKPSKPTYTTPNAADTQGWVDFPTDGERDWWECVGQVNGVTNIITEWGEVFPAAGSEGVPGPQGPPGEDGQNGVSGKSIEVRRAYNSSGTEYPAINRTLRNPVGWAIDPGAPPAGYYFTWETTATINPDNTLDGQWSIPYCKTGNSGSNGVSSFKSIIFIRSLTAPSTPTGGTYASPIPTSSPTWSDGIPAGTAPLYMSTRIFSNTGGSPQQAAWTTPRFVIDSPDFDFEWSTVAINPGNPTTNPSNWTNTPGTNSIWMAFREFKMGVWGAWVVSKIKGEDGSNGTNGSDGEDAPVVEYRWAVNTSLTIAPTISTSSRNPGAAWSTTRPVPTEEQQVWQTEARIRSDNTLYSNWQPPMRITGQQGPIGETGPIGPQGPAGAAGTAGIPGVSYENRFCLGTESTFDGTWNSTVQTTRNPSSYGWQLTIPQPTTAKPYIYQIQARIVRASNQDSTGTLEGAGWSIPFMLTGTKGLDGAPGNSQIAYPAGTYNMATPYYSTDRVVPYVFDPSDGNFYVMNYITTGGPWIGAEQGNITPSQSYANNGGQFWQLIQSHEAIYTKLLLTPNALIGSSVFNEEYMFSQQGIAKTGGARHVYRLTTTTKPSSATSTMGISLNNVTKTFTVIGGAANSMAKFISDLTFKIEEQFPEWTCNIDTTISNAVLIEYKKRGAVSGTAAITTTPAGYVGSFSTVTTGVNPTGSSPSSQYQLFNSAFPYDGDFDPNMMINFATGEARFAKGNLILAPDGNVNITGNFESNTSGNRIIISSADRNIKLISNTDKVLGNLSFTELQTFGSGSLTLNAYSNDVLRYFSSYTSDGLFVNRNNSYGVFESGVNLSSTGLLLTGKAQIQGFSLPVRSNQSSSNEDKFYSIYDYNTSTSGVTFTLDSNPQNGRILFIRNTSTNANSLTINGNGNQIYTGSTGSSTISLGPNLNTILIYMGGSWVKFV